MVAEVHERGRLQVMAYPTGRCQFWGERPGGHGSQHGPSSILPRAWLDAIEGSALFTDEMPRWFRNPTPRALSLIPGGLEWERHGGRRNMSAPNYSRLPGACSAAGPFTGWVDRPSAGLAVAMPGAPGVRRQRVAASN